MWLSERGYNRDQTAANQGQAMKMIEAVGRMAEAGERQADAIDALADQSQRTREESLRMRIKDGLDT
jgi:translation elongation factor EF-Tu-like GTPase